MTSVAPPDDPMEMVLWSNNPGPFPSTQNSVPLEFSENVFEKTRNTADGGVGVVWIEIAFATPQLPPETQVNPVMKVLADKLAVTSRWPVIVVVPWPFSVIPLEPGIVTFVDHVQDGPGTRTVSPDAAALIAFCTSVLEQELAVTVAA